VDQSLAVETEREAINMRHIIIGLTIAAALLPGLAGATPPIRGDYSCDGALAADDALVALQMSARLMPETACARFVDWTGDTEYDARDAFGILQRIGGIA